MARRRSESIAASGELTAIALLLVLAAVTIGSVRYYGRQLELGIAAQKPSTLTQAAADLQSTWNRIEPTIERRGDLDDARRFSDTVAQLIGARRPADFVSPTRAALTEAARIEKLYFTCASQSGWTASKASAKHRFHSNVRRPRCPIIVGSVTLDCTFGSALLTSWQAQAIS
jgi:C4-dicarboxylate-specific signal transduction histidine kinase